MQQLCYYMRNQWHVTLDLKVGTVEFLLLPLISKCVEGTHIQTAQSDQSTQPFFYLHILLIKRQEMENHVKEQGFSIYSSKIQNITPHVTISLSYSLNMCLHAYTFSFRLICL